MHSNVKNGSGTKQSKDMHILLALQHLAGFKMDISQWWNRFGHFADKEKGQGYRLQLCLVKLFQQIKNLKSQKVYIF